MGARNKEKAWEIDERREMGEGGEEETETRKKGTGCGDKSGVDEGEKQRQTGRDQQKK